MVVIKLLKIVSNYLPNEMIFILQSEFLLDFYDLPSFWHNKKKSAKLQLSKK